MPHRKSPIATLHIQCVFSYQFAERGRGMLRLLSVVILLTGAGCSTPYQNMGFAGGVAAQQMPAETFRIVSRGNSYTNTTDVQDYLMLKAAETTVQNGGTHFSVISAADASRTSQVVTSGTARTTFTGNTATTTYDPPKVTSLFKPGEDAYIRVYKANADQAPPPGAISAAEIIRFVGSRVKRPM